MEVTTMVIVWLFGIGTLSLLGVSKPVEIKKDPHYKLESLRERALYPCASLQDPACRSAREAR